MKTLTLTAFSLAALMSAGCSGGEDLEGMGAPVTGAGELGDGGSSSGGAASRSTMRASSSSAATSQLTVETPPASSSSASAATSSEPPATSSPPLATSAAPPPVSSSSSAAPEPPPVCTHWWDDPPEGDDSDLQPGPITRYTNWLYYARTPDQVIRSRESMEVVDGRYIVYVGEIVFFDSTQKNDVNRICQWESPPDWYLHDEGCHFIRHNNPNPFLLKVEPTAPGILRTYAIVDGVQSNEVVIEAR